MTAAEKIKLKRAVSSLEELRAESRELYSLVKLLRELGEQKSREIADLWGEIEELKERLSFLEGTKTGTTTKTTTEKTEGREAPPQIEKEDLREDLLKDLEEEEEEEEEETGAELPEEGEEQTEAA